MRLYYLDASAWLKRYFAEVGTDRVGQLFADGVAFGCADFGLIEVVAAISRRAHREQIPIERIEQQIAIARRDYTLFEQAKWDMVMGESAMSLAVRHHLRAADAIHLAAASMLAAKHEIVMVSSDQELLDASQREGLVTLNPAS